MAVLQLSNQSPDLRLNGCALTLPIQPDGAGEDLQRRVKNPLIQVRKACNATKMEKGDGAQVGQT